MLILIQLPGKFFLRLKTDFTELKVKLEQRDDFGRYKLHRQLLGDDFQWNIELHDIEEGREDQDVMILKKFVTKGRSI